MMELRPYQQAAFAAIFQAMQKERYLLLQAACGAGKTIMFSTLIKHCMNTYQMRIGILAHREILVRQAYDKLLKVWPEGKDQIGLACASVSQSIDLWRPVVIGSPQTLANRVRSMPPLDLLIIDECHRVPPRNVKSQYQKLLLKLEEYYPKMRVLGVTATPYRLGHGYIYGKKCRPGAENWWNQLHCWVSIADLQERGFLVHLKAKEAENIEDDLKHVSTSTGEYNLGQLGETMSRQCHLDSAVHAYQEYGEDRKHVVAFCVTIEHAELLRDAFRHAGYTATVIHSEMKKEHRQQAMADFESGKCRVICNVGVLTEGWDCTSVDCILFCRPTMSPALYVQMVGRGLRIHEGKEDCLLLDLSGNCRKHGDVNDPIVEVPTGAKKKDEEKQEPMRTCERCKTIFSIRYKCCPDCGWEPPKIEIEEKADVTMRDVKFINGPVPAKVIWWMFKDYTSQAGNHLVQVLAFSSAPDLASVPIKATDYWAFDENSSLWQRDKSRKIWAKLTGTEPPKSVEEALQRRKEIIKPGEVKVAKKGKYYNIVEYPAMVERTPMQTATLFHEMGMQRGIFTE